MITFGRITKRTGYKRSIATLVPYAFRPVLVLVSFRSLRSRSVSWLSYSMQPDAMYTSYVGYRIVFKVRIDFTPFGFWLGR